MWGFTDKVLAGYNLGVIYGIGHRHRGHHTQELSQDDPPHMCPVCVSNCKQAPPSPSCGTEESSGSTPPTSLDDDGVIVCHNAQKAFSGELRTRTS